MSFFAELRIAGHRAAASRCLRKAEKLEQRAQELREHATVLAVAANDIARKNEEH